MHCRFFTNPLAQRQSAETPPWNAYQLHSVRKYTQGFTYLGLMIFVASLGAVLASTGVVWHHAMQREKEDQLLWTGEQYRRAIEAYQKNSPGALKHGPTALQDLLKDQRHLGTVRYLRELYRDPMTNSREWGILRGTDGFIVGVYSSSQAAPIKKAHFSSNNRTFADATKYSEWTFVASPAGSVPTNSDLGAAQGAVAGPIPTSPSAGQRTDAANASGKLLGLR